MGRIELKSKLLTKLSKEFIPLLNARLAETTLGLVQDGFNDESDPYDRNWKARKHIGDGHPILDETGHLRNSFVPVVYKAGGFAVVNNVPYAAYHQYGTEVMPARRMLPAQTRIPRKYREAWQIVLDELVNEIR